MLARASPSNEKNCELISLANSLGLEFLSDNIDFFNNKVSSLGDRYNNIDLKCLYPSFCSFVDAPTGFVYPCDCSIHRDRKYIKLVI